MDTPETQVAETGEMVFAPKSFLPGGNTVAPAQPKAEGVQEPAQKAEKQPTQTPAAQAPAKQEEPPNAEEKAVEADPYEAVAEQSISPVEPVAKWTDDVKAAFKARFGVDDPIEIETRIEQANLLKQEYDALLPIKQGLEALPPAVKNAFDLAMNGKAEEALKYLKEIPEGVFLNKEAKHIPSDKLIPMYLEGKMTKEDFDILKNPSDYDEDVVAAVKMKEKHFRDIASDMHERKLGEVRNAQAEAQAQQKQAYENYVKNVAQTISHAKETPLKAFVTKEFEQEIHTGSFVQRLLQDDGVTPTQEAATLLLKALHYDKMMEAQYKVGYRKGKSEGTLDAANGKPGVPPVASRSAAAATGQVELTPAQTILANLGKRR